MGIYRDLDVWKLSRALAADVYRLTAHFPRAEWFGLVPQMRRAAVSIASNIAEGHGRSSDSERIRYLVIARGSTFELETQTLIAADLELITPENLEATFAQTKEITRKLNALILHYRKKSPNN